MRYTPQHPPLGFTPEPKPNPTINNPFTIRVVECAKTVENCIFCKKLIFDANNRKVLKLNNITSLGTQENPKSRCPASGKVKFAAKRNSPLRKEISPCKRCATAHIWRRDVNTNGIALRASFRMLDNLSLMPAELAFNRKKPRSPLLTTSKRTRPGRLAYSNAIKQSANRRTTAIAAASKRRPDARRDHARPNEPRLSRQPALNRERLGRWSPRLRRRALRRGAARRPPIG